MSDELALQPQNPSDKNLNVHVFSQVSQITHANVHTIYVCAHQEREGRSTKTFESSFQAGMLKFGCLFKVYLNVSESFGLGNQSEILQGQTFS